MNKSDLVVKALNTSFDYEEYKAFAEKELNSFDASKTDQIFVERNEARKINLVRMSRIEKQFQPNEESIELLKNIDQNLLWIVISESWCGDSAQSLPVISRLAFLNPLINLKIIPRDKNLDYMDIYLTDGKRSIPKLIVYNDDLIEIASWGPRPKTAQHLMEDMLKNNLPKSERLKKLHLWYAKNKGAEIESEIVQIIKEITPKIKIESLASSKL